MPVARIGCVDEGDCFTIPAHHPDKVLFALLYLATAIVTVDILWVGVNHCAREVGAALLIYFQGQLMIVAGLKGTFVPEVHPPFGGLPFSLQIRDRILGVGWIHGNRLHYQRERHDHEQTTVYFS